VYSTCRSQVTDEGKHWSNRQVFIALHYLSSVKAPTWHLWFRVCTRSEAIHKTPFCSTHYTLPIPLYATSLIGDLNDGWASGDSVIVYGVSAGGEDNVGLSINSRRDDERETSINRGSLGVERASNGDESTVDRGGSVSRGDGVVGGQEGDSVTRLDGAGGAESEGGESLDGKSGVGLGAVDDEAGGESVDLVEVKRSVERLGEGALLLSSTEVRGVAGLDGQDGSSCGQVGLGSCGKSISLCSEPTGADDLPMEAAAPR
jgi:hypothetical protein